MRSTIQRRVILDALRRRADHPSADDLFEDVRRRLPDLSRTTVYRVLDALVRGGFARRVNQPGARARFDARTDRHHHVVCSRCEKICDYDERGLNTLPFPRVAGFEIVDYSIQFTGVCAACRRRRR